MKILKENKIVRSALALVGTLFIGAIGSGIWELFLKGFFLWLGNSVLSLIASVWIGYIDILHREIGKLEEDILVLPLYSVFVVIYISAPWIAVIKLSKEISAVKINSNDQYKRHISEINISNRIKKIKRTVNFLLIPMSALMTAIMIISLWQTVYTRSVCSWSKQSLEIIAPYVSEREMIVYKSQLRQVNGAEKFYKIYDSIIDVANKNNIILPKIYVIGKNTNG